MSTLSFPLWLIFLILMPIAIVFFVLGFSSAAITVPETPPPIQRGPS